MSQTAKEQQAKLKWTPWVVAIVAGSLALFNWPLAVIAGIVSGFIAAAVESSLASGSEGG